MSVVLNRWQALSPAEQTAVLGLSVTPQQVEFAGSVARSVEICEADQDDQLAGLAVLQGRRVVGFLVLKRGSNAPAWANPAAATITAMRIDLSCQGMGLGSAALHALPAWVMEHWPQVPELILSVDEENLSARRAYAKAGFKDRGLREPGRIGWVRYMSRPLSSGVGHVVPTTDSIP